MTRARGLDVERGRSIGFSPGESRQPEFSEQSLSWILNAYTLIFGGFLLLGGRLADRLGRRRLFMVRIALFSAASLVCGVTSPPVSCSWLGAFRGWAAR